MVCFTKHSFNFNNNNKQIWFNILCKYYSGVSCTITIDNTQHTGTISHNFLNQLPDGNNYVLVTDRFWAEQASTKVMSNYNKNLIVAQYSETDVTDIVASINSVISDRLDLKGLELYISSSFSCDNFEKVISAIKYIDSEYVTKLYISDNFALLLLSDTYTISVGIDGCGDGCIPVFDLDDGFIPNAFGFGKMVCEKWNVYFQKWLDEFKISDGANWDDFLIPMQEHKIATY